MVGRRVGDPRRQGGDYKYEQLHQLTTQTEQQPLSQLKPHV